MEKNNDHEKIESFFRSLPKQQDQRTKDEILTRLRQDKRLSSNTVSKNKRRWLPIFTATAALLLLAVMLPSFLSSSKTDEKSVNQFSADHETSSTHSDESRTLLENSRSTDSTDIFTGKTSVYEQDLQSSKIFTIGLRDSQSLSIPISFIISQEQLLEKGVSLTSTDLEIYNAFANTLDEEAMDFKPLHPLSAKLSEQGERLDVLLQNLREYDSSPAKFELLFHTLLQTFPSYKEIHVLDRTGRTANFSEIGTVEPLRQVDSQRTPYFIYEHENGRKLLAPDFMQQTDSLADALKMMQTAPSDLFAAPIPKNNKFSVKQKDSLATIKFEQPLFINQLEHDEAELFINSLTLTAKSFGLRLQVENIEPKEWNGIDFEKPLPTAMGPNLFTLTEEKE